MIDTHHTGLDFDGTVTEVEKEATPYTAGYKKDVAAHLGLPHADLNAIWDSVEREVLAEPTIFGWPDKDGRIVAPATADPLILARVVTEHILGKLIRDPQGLGISSSPSLVKALPKSDAERHKLIEGFFENNYPKLETHFRPGAADFLRELLELGKLTIVTNSGTANVQKKLAKLRESNPGLPAIDVRGSAEKYTIVPDFVIDGIAAELDCKPDLLRPVFTQRGKYYQVLKDSGIFEATSSVVAGDVWELDLMLPLLLDMKAAFITRPMTPQHELAIVQREVDRGRATIASNLEELFANIKELHANAA